MRVLLMGIAFLFFMTGCSAGTDDKSSAPPLQGYKQAIDNAKMVKQLEQDANQQRMPSDAN